MKEYCLVVNGVTYTFECDELVLFRKEKTCSCIVYTSDDDDCLKEEE